ncbi:hypothetical protein [Cohnella sp. JJ-181]|uniref:hypothetical protein n=1 Tax=Cohnella rhizoplanae TaxID=2974897 RepID=UPI0022FFBE1D|nr:hypothetical protein [Cohnella sp. JJ-181]CAI6031768.1 hypothetical protein COHCIP112018_00731 [Cohnella sp. JJ-181]
MSQYFKLLALEVRRFRYVLAGIMVYTLIVECVAVALDINNHSRLFEWNNDSRHSFAEVIRNTQSGFQLAIVIPVAVLLAYALLIWYRDWFGRHPFIYRQMTIPGGRAPLYFSKLTAILLFVFSMVAWQLVLMSVLRIEYVWLTPDAMQEAVDFTEAMTSNEVFNTFLLPPSFKAFALNYGLGILLILILFTGVLMERSYRIMGIVAGLIYAALNVTLLILPTTFGLYLYSSEIWAICLIVFGLEVAAALWISLILVSKKVSA